MRVWLAVALTLFCTAVFGHDSEQWINDEKLVDPVSKVICCGPTDCSVLAPGSVERVQGGYKVNTGKWPGIDLRTLDRHHEAAVTSLIPARSCRSCRPNAPFAELVRLSPTSIADEMREDHRRRVLGE